MAWGGDCVCTPDVVDRPAGEGLISVELVAELVTADGLHGAVLVVGFAVCGGDAGHDWDMVAGKLVHDSFSMQYIVFSVV